MTLEEIKQSLQNSSFGDLTLAEVEKIANDPEKLLIFLEEIGAIKIPPGNEKIKNEIIQKLKIEKIYSIIPDKGILPISKVAKNSCELINGVIGGVYVDNEKTVGVSVTPLNDNLQLPDNYNKFDECVQNAVSTLIEAGNRLITADTVYRVMNGLTNGEKVTPQAIKSVTKSIYKQRSLSVTIDYSEQAKLYHKEAESFKITRYIIPCDIIEAETRNGTKKEAFRITGLPPIYEYSKTFNHARTLPIELYNIKSLRASENTIIIKTYLLTQIESMRGKNGKPGRNSTINYDTILKDCQIKIKKSNPADTVKKYRDYIKIMLDQWKEQGYIKDYKEVKKGRVFTGVKIELENKKS